jgi:hypothetical protein
VQLQSQAEHRYSGWIEGLSAQWRSVSEQSESWTNAVGEYRHGGLKPKAADLASPKDIVIR